MLNAKRVVGLTILAFGIINSGHAFAGKTIYPASMCTRWTSTDVVPRLSGSRIFNDSTSQWMRVDCPILHQHFGAVFQNDDQDDSDIGVIDANNGADARCWSLSKYQSGSNFFTAGNGGTRTTTGFGNHEQNLDFAFVNHNGESWSYIGCNIPPRQNGASSGITYYSAEE